MANPRLDRGVSAVLAAIDIPESGYEKAAGRYKDLAEWFCRADSKCAPFSPHIYPQGSFRLGTAVRPIADDGEYDLDVGCRMRVGITKQSHTQRQVKHLVGAEVAAYRVARKISAQPEEKRRCWRLKYADEMSFHVDTVPSIPEEAGRRNVLREGMVRAGTTNELAGQISDLTGAITDNQLPNYDLLSQDWRISNSEGYALWFESRMKLAGNLLQERVSKARVSRIEALPTYKWRSPLQACVQLLKRHRDMMFADNSDAAPISVIITTLAARAYTGEADLASALLAILIGMGSYVNQQRPRVPNPVNPAEDFADKWGEGRYAALNLEANFRRWLVQAAVDFRSIGDAVDDRSMISEARKRLGVTLDPTALSSAPGGTLLAAAVTPGGLTFPPKPVVPQKPAGFAY